VSDHSRLGLSFAGWVRKWRIGPGLNDRHPQIRAWLEVEARIRGEALVGGMLALLDEGLYSGFDGTVGPGWIPLLDRLARDLLALGWDRDLHQVKEKFGALRFYVGQRTPAMDARIEAAEEESARICETCGRPGILAAEETGWLLTLCKGCRARRCGQPSGVR
jgi:hypothetical protein